MSLEYNKPMDVYTTAAEILATMGVAGQHAFAKDTMTIYIHNGTNWITGYALGKIIGAGNTPAPAVGSLAGSGATITIDSGGTNLIGTVRIKTGTTLSTSGVLFSITLADSAAYPTTTTPIITAASGNATSFLQNYWVTPTTTGFSVSCSGVTVNAGNIIVFNYFDPGY